MTTKSIISVFIWISYLNIMKAQPALSLSLDEAVEMGLENNFEIKAQLISQKIVDNANDKIRAQKTPQISSNADFRLNTQLQSTVLPFDITGQNPEGTSTVRFGTRFQNTLGLHLEQIIFDPTNKVQWNINLNRMEEQKQATEQATQVAQKEIIEAYYTAIYYREKSSLELKTMERARSNSEVGQRKYEAGDLLENNLLRFEVALKNAEFEWQKTNDQFAKALLILKEKLHLDPEIELELTDGIAKFEKQIFDKNQKMPESQHPEIRRLELDIKHLELKKELDLAQKKISLNAYAHYGLLHLNDQLNPFQNGTWFPYNYLGIGINLPLLDGQQAKLRAQDQALLQDRTALELEEVRYNFLQMEIQASLELEKALKSVKNAQENIEFAEKVYKLDQVRFQEGTLLPIDLRESENELQVTQKIYLEAVYQLLIADLQLKVARGIY